MVWVQLLRNYPIPTSLPTKGRGFFIFIFLVVGFLERGKRIFSRITRVFYQNFSTLSLFFPIFLSFSPYFFPKNERVFIEDEENGGLARCNMLHLSQDDMLSIQYISLGIFFSLFVPSSFTIFFGVNEIKNCFKRKPRGG